MAYTKEERIEKFTAFMKGITADDKVAVLHHTDPDGISSGVIVAKTIERLRGKQIDLRLNQGHGEIAVKAETVAQLKEAGITKFIVVDMSVDQQYSELVRITSFASVMVLDHHKIYNDLNAEKLLLIKPQMLSPIEPSSYPAAKLCYDLCSTVTDIAYLDWVASLGVIGDVASSAWKDFLQQVFAKYAITFSGDYFKTKLGEVCELISLTEAYDITKMGECFDLVYGAEGYQKVLQSSLVQYKDAIQEDVHYWSEHVEELADVYDDLELIFYVIKPKFMIKSNLSTILSFKYPHKTLVIAQDKGDGVISLSGRRRDHKVKVNDLFEQAIKGFQDANAGGHASAAGGKFLKRDLGAFKERLLKGLKKKESFADLVDLEVWKKVQDKFASAIKAPIYTIDLDGNDVILSNTYPFFYDLIKSKRPGIFLDGRLKHLQELQHEQSKILTYRNDAGLLHIMAPVVLQGALKGAIEIGCLVKGEHDTHAYKDVARATDIGYEELKDASQELVVLDKEKVNHFVSLLSILSKTLPDISVQKFKSDKKIDELTVLYEISKKINTVLNIQALVGIMKHFLTSQFQAQKTSVFFMDEKYELSATEQSLFNLVQKEQAITEQEGIVGIPLILQDKVYALVFIYQPKLELHEEEKAFLTIIANQLSLALLNAKQYHEINKLAVTDQLTGLYNRRYFLTRLGQEIAKSKEKKQPLSLILFDLDYFKVYNDTNGHVAGDDLLTSLGSLMRKEVREVDTAGRYGGEEFIVLLPGLKTPEARQVADRLREKVMQYDFEHKESQPSGTVTISLGLVTCMNGSMSVEDMLKAADKALYEAKEKRNNVVAKIYIDKHMQAVDG